MTKDRLEQLQTKLRNKIEEEIKKAVELIENKLVGGDLTEFISVSPWQMVDELIKIDAALNQMIELIEQKRIFNTPEPTIISS